VPPGYHEEPSPAAGHYRARGFPSIDGGNGVDKAASRPAGRGRVGFQRGPPCPPSCRRSDGPPARGPVCRGPCEAARSRRPLGLRATSGSGCSAACSTAVCPREDDMWRPGNPVRLAGTLLPSCRWGRAMIASTAGAHGPPPSRTSTSVTSAMRSWRWGTWPTGRLTQTQDLPDAAAGAYSVGESRSSALP
jgi:hypothetical protein